MMTPEEKRKLKNEWAKFTILLLTFVWLWQSGITVKHEGEVKISNPSFKSFEIKHNGHVDHKHSTGYFKLY